MVNVPVSVPVHFIEANKMIIRVNPCKFVVKNPTYLPRRVGRVEKHYLINSNHYEKDKPTDLHRLVGSHEIKCLTLYNQSMKNSQVK